MWVLRWTRLADRGGALVFELGSCQLRQSIYNANYPPTNSFDAAAPAASPRLVHLLHPRLSEFPGIPTESGSYQVGGFGAEDRACLGAACGMLGGSVAGGAKHRARGVGAVLCGEGGSGGSMDGRLIARAWGYGQTGRSMGMNYPGSGGSEGYARISHWLPPMRSACLTRCVKPRTAGRFSFTPGALGRRWHCVSRPVSSGCGLLILQNPPPLRQLILERYGWWNLWLLAFAGPVARSGVPTANLIRLRTPGRRFRPGGASSSPGCGIHGAAGVSAESCRRVCG